MTTALCALYLLGHFNSNAQIRPCFSQTQKTHTQNARRAAVIVRTSEGASKQSACEELHEVTLAEGCLNSIMSVTKMDGVQLSCHHFVCDVRIRFACFDMFRTGLCFPLHIPYFVGSVIYLCGKTNINRYQVTAYICCQKVSFGICLFSQMKCNLRTAMEIWLYVQKKYCFCFIFVTKDLS